MDSRFRGNDGGNPHILREKLILEFPQKDRKIKFIISAKSCENKIFHSGKTRRNSAKKNAVIPAKAGIYSGRLILEFREFYGKLSLKIPAHFTRKFGISANFFFAKNEVNAGICR